MERVIQCPICLDTDNCFEESQPNYSSYLCFKCGFMSDSRYKSNSLELIENLKKSPQLVKELAFEDRARGITWLLSVINMGSLGIIYPEGNAKEYNWKYAKVVEIPEEERGNYNNYDQRLDVENAETFKKNEFLKACDAMGVTKDMKSNA